MIIVKENAEVAESLLIELELKKTNVMRLFYRICDTIEISDDEWNDIFISFLRDYVNTNFDGKFNIIEPTRMTFAQYLYGLISLKVVME